MRTQDQCDALIGKRVTTPKGDGVVVEVKMADGETPVELRVKLDSYATKGGAYDGTWMREDEVTERAPNVATAFRTSQSITTVATPFTFTISVEDLTDIAFAAGVTQGNLHLSEMLKGIVARALGRR